MTTYLAHPQYLYEHFSDPKVRSQYLRYIHNQQHHPGPYVDPTDILDQVIRSLAGKQPPSYTTHDAWLKAACRLLTSQARWKFYNRPSECHMVYGLTTLNSTPPESNEKASNLIDSCLPMLTAKQQHVVRGLYFLCESKAELGRQLGCTPQSVEALHKRALTRMRKIIQSQQAHPQ